jgi:peptidoglycan/LPS O-acetylase OafA/YrhL
MKTMYSRASSTHRGDIEGMRALAVAFVVVYHTGASWLSGGFVGVDVFFVISGYLITKLLVDEADHFGSISLRNFWARRMRRLLPMSLVVVVATVLFGAFMLEPGRLRELTTVALGAIGFSTNFVLYFTSSEYLLGVTPPSPLQHYWSLAVEEQFYLLWPLVVVGVLKLGRKQWKNSLLIVVVVAFIASLITSIVMTPINPGGGYYLPHARFWEILMGAGLALVGTRIQRVDERWRAAGGWLGLVLIVGAAILFDNSTTFPGSAALFPVVGAALVLSAGGTTGGPHTILSLGPLQRIGAWSFSLYLWHWPIFVLVEAEFGTPTPLGWVALIALSVGLSALTYERIENPIRIHGWLALRSNRSIVFGLGSVLAVFAATSVLFAYAPAIDAKAQRFVVPADFTGAENLAIDEVASQPAPEPKDVDVLLLGDSTMATLRWFEDGQKSLEGFDYVLDVESCRKISLKSCEGREKRVPLSAAETLRAYAKPVDVVVLMAGYHSWTEQFDDEIREIADAAKYKGTRLVVLTLKESLKFPAPGSRGTRSVYTDFNEVLKGVVQEDSYKQVALANWNLFSFTSLGWFERDGIHLTLKGTVALGWYLSRIVAEAVDNPCPDDGSYPCITPKIADNKIDWLDRYDVQDTDIHCYEDGPKRTRTCTKNRRI